MFIPRGSAFARAGGVVATHVAARYWDKLDQDSTKGPQAKLKVSYENLPLPSNKRPG
jgi:hypothetical protein